MSKLTTSLVAVVFTTGAVAGTPAWADLADRHYDRGQHVRQLPAGNYRGQPVMPVPVVTHRNRDNALILGLGILAGAAILLAATDPKPVAYSDSVPVYVPPPTYYPPTGLEYSSKPVAYLPSVSPAIAYASPRSPWSYYCAQSAEYYPQVRQCSRGWTKIARRHPG